MIEIGGVSLATAVFALFVAVGSVIALSIFIAIVRQFLYICRPNEVLLFAGRKHTLADGAEVGYKVVRRGWALRTPLLETISGAP